MHRARVRAAGGLPDEAAHDGQERARQADQQHARRELAHRARIRVREHAETALAHALKSEEHEQNQRGAWWPATARCAGGRIVCDGAPVMAPEMASHPVATLLRFQLLHLLSRFRPKARRALFMGRGNGNGTHP